MTTPYHPTKNSKPREEPAEPIGASPDGPTAAEEQRARSEEIEDAGAGAYPPDERPEEAKNKQVPGVGPVTVDDGKQKGGKS